MRRRDFLKYSSLILPASAAIGMINPFTKNIFAAVKNSGSFSLSVITDKPSKTIHMMEQAIKNSEYGSRTLDFTEYRLKGQHIGDIAYVKSQKLVDYHKGSDEFSLLLNDSARVLSLPDPVDDPVLLRFSSQQNPTEAGGINIFRGNTLIKQLPLENDRELYRVEGLKGHIDIRIKNRSVKIVSATCKHKTCMNMDAISRPGENLICVPNQINISIAGKSALGVDSITF
ncbi:MAG TPA: NusG domain II-containing protein [Ignavibacteriaceae bacterium]|nr:NusG domain II-containing protein [Ignavibacteriaceae bacterium]